LQASSDESATPRQPCTLEAYADAKRLPVEFLRELGLSTVSYMGTKAVRMPYLAEDGSEGAVRLRLALEKGLQGDNRFRWRKGSKPTLYGLWRMERVREAGYVVLVEGESDCHTLWRHGVEALGVPGASNWKEEWSEHLAGIEKVYAVIEPDEGGQALKERLISTPVLRDRLRLVELGEAEDASALYLADSDRFMDHLRAAFARAKPWADELRAEEDARTREAREACRELAGEDRILDRFAEALRRSGVAGEARTAKLLYLALTSRLLTRPVSVAVKGPSSGGKTYLVERVLSFFPEAAYHALTAMSERTLAYSEEPIRHRFLVIYEADGMASDFATYLMRSLLSEGKVRYETVESTSEGIRPRLIEREGPTGLVITTTAVKLHPENETRLLSLTVTDTQDQTRSVLRALAQRERHEPDLVPWLALQEWLGSPGAERRVEIPYAPALAELVPPVAVRLRRDFGAVLNLIRAHAVLHQQVRDRDEDGRIIATLDDYAAVRELVADLVSEGVEATVPNTVRETVAAVGRLLDGSEGDPVTTTAVALELKLDKSAALRRVRAAIDRGHLKNLEDRRGRPARIVLGDPLSGEVEVLPSAERLQGCTQLAGEPHPPPPEDPHIPNDLVPNENGRVQFTL
jgi:urease gamma subunit